MSPQLPAPTMPAFPEEPVLDALGTFLAELGLHRTAEVLRDETGAACSTDNTSNNTGEQADNMRRLAAKIFNIASSNGDYGVLHDKAGTQLYADNTSVPGKENAIPQPSCGEEQWLDGVLKKLAASDMCHKSNTDSNPVQDIIRGSSADFPTGIDLTSDGSNPLGKTVDTAVPMQAGKALAELVEQGEIESQTKSLEPQTCCLQCSEYYDPRRPGVPIDGVNDEYRDDGDAGYRVLHLSEAELLAELQAKYYAALAASAAVPAALKTDCPTSGEGKALLVAAAIAPGPDSQQTHVAVADSANQSLAAPSAANCGTAVGSSEGDEKESISEPPTDATVGATIAASTATVAAGQLPAAEHGTNDAMWATAATTAAVANAAVATGHLTAADNGTNNTIWAQQNFALPVQPMVPQAQQNFTAPLHTMVPHVLASARKPRNFSGQPRPVYRYAPSGDAFYPVECDGVVFDSFNLRVVYERDRTGFEESKEFPVQVASIIAGRYQVLSYIGSAAFSRAVQCLDLQTGEMICMKIIKNDKDFMDQSFDEIKLLKLINANTENVDDKHCLRLIDYFYHKEHLFIVTELLRDNLYEFSKFNREGGEEPYFTLGRLQRITKQLLVALKYIHSLWLIHADLKPENILMKSYSRCEVKLIDFGSSCFVDDRLLSYVQSRSYRAPEVLLGLPYNQQIDLWSLGCVIAEVWTGYVLFQNDSVQSLLARIIGIIGPLPREMMHCGRFVPQYFTQDGRLYRELDVLASPDGMQTDVHRQIQLLLPKVSSLRQRMRTDDEQFLDFLSSLLRIDPTKRLSAAQALEHPWLAPGRYPDGL